VLAFDLNPKHLPLKALKALRGHKLDLNGEVIVSVEMAFKQSKEFKTTASEELLLYIVHGILHLRGYDDHKPKDIEKMRAKEKTILIKLNSQRFYPLIGS
jgi:probable rRNA maturation factor